VVLTADRGLNLATRKWSAVSKGYTMAKRYSSSMNHHSDKFNDEKKHNKDSRNGSMGFRHQGAEGYAGSDARKSQEMQDGGMIRENPAAIANLPQEVMIKPYPRTGPYLPEGIDDTIRGVDMQMDYDDSQRSSHLYPKKV